MLQRKPRRKLLYPAGLFSLAILPLLGYQFYSTNYPIQNLKCMEVIYWDGKVNSDFSNSLPLITKTKFNRISLNGSKEDDIKLSYAQVAIREMVRSEIDGVGFEFTFEETTSYSSLVRLLDICEIEGATRYLNHGDKFWVLNFNRKIKDSISSKSSYQSICGTSLYSDLFHNKTLPKIQAETNWVLLILPSTLFCCLILLQIRFLYNLYKLKIIKE